MRNLKVGQQVLDYIAEHLDDTRLLEVEPTTDEMTTRRVNYYRRNGYEILDKTYMQPSYDEDIEVGNLWIMGNRKSDRLQEFIERIKQVAYKGKSIIMKLSFRRATYLMITYTFAKVELSFPLITNIA